MNKPAFRPLGARYLVLPDEVKGEETQVGEFTVSREKDIHNKSQSGTVVAVGKGCTELKENDHVAYGQYSGYEKKIEGKNYVILQESEILGEILVTPFDEEPSLPLGMGTIL